MNHFSLTLQQIADYHKDGYVIVKDFLSHPEVEKLYNIATGDDAGENSDVDAMPRLRQ